MLCALWFEDGLALVKEGVIPLFRFEARAAKGTVGGVLRAGSPSEREVKIIEKHCPTGLTTVEHTRRHEVQGFCDRR